MTTFPRAAALVPLLALAGLALSSRATAQCLSEELVPAVPSWNHGGSFALAGDDVVCASGGAWEAYFFERGASGWDETARFSLGPQTILQPVAAAHGSTAAIGDPATGVGGDVKVFEKGAGGWAPVTTLESSHPEGFAEFGWAVAVQEDEIFVGSPFLLLGGPGSVYVFERTASVWSEVQELPGAGGGFGMSIAVDGDTLVVASPYNDNVSVFERGSNGWVFLQQLTAPDGEAGDVFGASVDVAGDTILVGSSDDGNANRGSAYVFEKTAGWSFARKLVSASPMNGARFGRRVALRGERALIAAPERSSGRGRSELFGRVGGAWTHLAVIDPPVSQTNQYFGRGVLGDGFAVVGAPGIELNAGRGELYEFAVGAAESPIACSATSNSTGAAGTLTQYGCPSVQANDLTLVAGSLPPGALGIVFFGAPGAQRPLFDGVLCMAPPFFRLPPRRADADGVLDFTLGFSGAPESNLTPGTVWTFQALYRDPSGGPAGVNTTDAVSLTVEP